jgi:hypothetical protein
MSPLPSIDDLAARVTSRVLGEALGYWRGFYDGGRLPAFDDIEPWRIKRVLPYLWIWRRDIETDRFACRVCGEHVNDVFGRNLSGRSVEEVMPPAMADEAQARWRRLIDRKLAHHLVGCVYNFVDRQVMGERLILPLAPSRNDRGGVLGVTDVGQPALRITAPLEPAKFVGVGVGDRRDYDADPARRPRTAGP